MKTPTFKQRFQYWFDNYMSRGTGALIFGVIRAFCCDHIRNCRIGKNHWKCPQ